MTGVICASSAHTGSWRTGEGYQCRVWAEAERNPDGVSAPNEILGGASPQGQIAMTVPRIWIGADPKSTLGLWVLDNSILILARDNY